MTVLIPFYFFCVCAKCSMTDGRLLKTTYPAMSLDSTFLRRVFGDKGPNGQMTAAYTEVAAWDRFVLQSALNALDNLLAAGLQTHMVLCHGC